MISKSNTISSSHGKQTQGFQNKLKMFLGALCGLIFILAIILSLPVYLFRVVVIVLAKLFRPDLGNILNGQSSYLVNDYFLNKKSPRASIVVSLCLQGRDMSITELQETVMKQWINARDSLTGKLRFEQFQQYPVRWLGFTFYKNLTNTFDINNHVYIHDQAKCKTNFIGDEDINNICEKLMNAPYKPCTSLWEVHLVKNYKSDKTKAFDPNENANVIIFKFHHSLADGYSILTAIVEGLFQINLANIKLPTPRFPKRNLKQKILTFICYPFTFIYELSYYMSQMFHSSRFKIPNEKKEWHQHCAKSDLIPIDKVKFIKNKLDVSFTSVLLYSLSCAIHKSLQNGKYKSPNTNQVKNYFDDLDNLKSMYCVSVLPLPGHSTQLTNHYSDVFFDLPIGNNDSIVNGLQKVDNMLETTKQSVIPTFVPMVLALIGWHLYPVGKLMGMQRMFQIAISNFPSVPFQVEQNNRKWIAVDFLCGGLDGVAGVAVSVLSYGEYIRIGVTAEKAVMSKDEITKFTSYMLDEINNLYDEASLIPSGSSSKDRLTSLYGERNIECLRMPSIQVA